MKRVMAVLFTFGNCRVDIDVEKNREASVEHGSCDCTCAACRNFKEYVKLAPSAILDLFDALRLDLAKPGGLEGRKTAISYMAAGGICAEKFFKLTVSFPEA